MVHLMVLLVHVHAPPGLQVPNVHSVMQRITTITIPTVCNVHPIHVLVQVHVPRMVHVRVMLVMPHLTVNTVLLTGLVHRVFIVWPMIHAVVMVHVSLVSYHCIIAYSLCIVLLLRVIHHRPLSNRWCIGWYMSV